MALRARVRFPRSLPSRNRSISAFAAAARFKPAVDRFFTELLVMDPDPRLRKNRLRLLRSFRDLVLELADISEIVAEDKG